jgi:hypothetical protein
MTRQVDFDQAGQRGFEQLLEHASCTMLARFVVLRADQCLLPP